MYIEQMYTSCLAEAAYYIESEGEAIVIDPLRDPSPYIEKAKSRNARIKYVFESHFHADFVSGHIDLAKLSGATIVYGPLAETGYAVHNATDGEEFVIGKIKIQVLHTPGHTPESSCFLLFDEQGLPNAVFTGDTLFVGDVGRPDLLDGKMSKEELAGMMFESLKKLKALPDNTVLYPAHGLGSACGKNIGKETWSSIGEQKAQNYALKITDKDEFIKAITSGLSEPPSYFFEDARINKEGYEGFDMVLKASLIGLGVSEFERLMGQGAVVLDSRTPDQFEKGFVKGSINIGLNGSFAVWVGSLIDIKSRLLIVAEPGKEEETITRLARVGYDNVAGYLKGGFESWKVSGKDVDEVISISADELKNILAEDELHLLDVRKPGEVEMGKLSESNTIELVKLAEGMMNLDKNDYFAVYCAGGYRSMIAASMMKRKGFSNIYNVYGGFAEIQKAGIPLMEKKVNA